MVDLSSNATSVNALGVQITRTKGDRPAVCLLSGPENIILHSFFYREGDECGFKPGEKVGIIYTAFNKLKPDPRALLVKVAEEMKLDVYTGVPEPPRISSDQESADLMQIIFQLTYRLMHAHEEKYSKNKAFKGYYSDIELNPGMLLTNPDYAEPLVPPRFAAMFWRELMFLSGSVNLKLIIAPHIDLRRSSPSNITNILDGFASILFFATPYAFLIRDGRANGTSAYFNSSEADQPIYKHEPKLWEVLYSKNKTISKDVKYADVYSNSTNLFFSELNKKFGSENIWLMIEAYNELSGDACLPLDPTGSGMDRAVERIHKPDIDRAIAGAGEMVNKIAAFAWDPLFLCHKKGNYSLFRELQYADGVITSCEISNKTDLTIDAYGFGLDRYGIKIYFYTKNGRREAIYGSTSTYLIWGEQHNAKNSKLQLVRMGDIFIPGAAPYGIIEVELRSHILLFDHGLPPSRCTMSYLDSDIDDSVFG